MSIPKEIYRDFDPWHLDHFPPIENKRNHTILFQYPFSNDQSQSPAPRVGKKKWNSNYVRMPCATQNELKVEDSSDPTESVTENRWKVIQKVFSKGIQSTQELEQAILTYNPEHAKLWKFESLHILFERYLDKSESELFFEQTLPNIIRLALQLPDIIPGAIPLLKHDQNRKISMSQKQIACLLANAFLCTFPGRSGIHQSSKEFLTYPSINFSSLFQTFGNASLQKIKCFCNYFRRVCSKMPSGVVTFSRRSISQANLPKWNKCQMDFTNSLLHVSKDGKIEDGIGLLQVDFANRYLGGGVLGGGCVQEEIIFMICPELLCSRLFTECLEDNECVTIMGFERFSDYKGYRFSLEYAGDFKDDTPSDLFRRRKSTLVAIDAMPFRIGEDQYREHMLRRELNKAFVGFKHELPTLAPGVATGNWGCGAYNGNKRLKALLQLIACVVTDRPMVYYTFGGIKLCDELITFHKYLSESKITIAEVWALLRRYAELRSKEHLYEFIRDGHENSSRAKTQPNSTSNLSKFGQFCLMFKRYFGGVTPPRTKVDDADDDQGNSSGNKNVPSKKSDEMEASCSKDCTSN